MGTNQSLPARLSSDCTYYWFVSGEYREARRVALEVRARAFDPEAYASFKFEDIVAPLSLVFLGEWGEALKEFAESIAEAQKNANDSFTIVLRVLQAWMHVQAQDFMGAVAICESALPGLRDSPLHPGPGWPKRAFRSALICTGSASVALGDYERALEDLSAARSEMDRHTVFLDWYWSMPLTAGVTELWLAKGDHARAHLEAERFLGLSLAAADPTWQGLAWEVNARVAFESGDHARARDCIGKALSTLAGFEAPLAAWRVHATAALIDEESGNRKSAHSHRDASRATILRLADSLGEQEPLRNIFLSAPAVAWILDRNS
jgi:tetratricopeptide (TPR) repeat protein